MLQIIKKEIRQMIYSPAYFVIMAVFIGLLNFLFLKSFFVNAQMNFRDYFDLQIWFLMIFIPAISMRIMSEEFKNGAIEFLLTKPISLLKIIFGKYLSLAIYFSIFIISSLVLYFSLSSIGNFPSGIIISQIFGSILLIFSMFSISFLASSITKNQVFAFLLGVLLNFILIITGTDFIQISLPYFLANFLNQFSYFYHISNFAKGLINLSDILYFSSIIFFSIYLSYLSINNYKKTGKIGLGFSSGIELSVIFVILVFANILFAKANIFADLTPNKVYTLSNSTKNILKKTNDVINVNLYVSKDLPPQLKTIYTNTKDLIKQFNNYAGNKIVLKEIHPLQDDKETEALKDGISPIQAQILKDDQFTTQKLYLGLALKYLDKTENIAYLGANKNLEYSLISKILKLTNDKRKSVNIIYSDDIDNQIVYLMNKTLSENYDVNSKRISKDTKDTKEINNFSDINIILEGDNKFNSEISKSIEENMKNKTTIYFFQPTKVDLQNGLTASKNRGELSANLLEKFNLKLKDGIVGDAKYNSRVSVSQGFMNYMLPYPFFPKTFINKDLPIGEGITNVDAPFISGIESNSGSLAKDLLTTSKYGFEYNKLFQISPNDLKNISKSDLAKISLAKFIAKGNTKIAFIPSSYMFTMGSQMSLIQNLGFLSNITDYLGGNSSLINIRGKTINYETFVIEKDKKSFIRGLNIFFLPILLLIIGLSIAFVRNRKRA